MKNNEKQQQPKNELQILKECINYCLGQVRESEAHVLEDTTGKGYDSVAYLEYQLMTLNGINKDLDEAIEDMAKAEAHAERMMSMLDEVLGEILGHECTHCGKCGKK